MEIRRPNFGLAQQRSLRNEKSFPAAVAFLTGRFECLLVLSRRSTIFLTAKLLLKNHTKAPFTDAILGYFLIVLFVLYSVTFAMLNGREKMGTSLIYQISTDLHRRKHCGAQEMGFIANQQKAFRQKNKTRENFKKMGLN